MCVKMLKRTGLNENNVPPSGLVRRGEKCFVFFKENVNIFVFGSVHSF